MTGDHTREFRFDPDRWKPEPDPDTDPDGVELPPTYADYLSARADEHRAAAAMPEQAARIARTTAAEQARKTSRWYVVVAFVVALVVGVLGGVLGAYNTAGLAALQQQSDARQQQTDEALAKLREANSELEARGQQPVQAPADPSASDAVTAAITARVIASMPTTPTAQDVANAIVPAVTANVLGPSQSTLAGLVAAYFVRNPPQPGPPPSEAAIRAAVDASLAANPAPAGPEGKKGDPCLPTDPACVGPEGKKGDPGATGPAGPPVAGWTYRDALNQPHTCTRDPSSPDAAPTYSCD